MPQELMVYNRLWWQYVEIGQLYCEKISSFCQDAYFMTYASHAGNEVDVNLRLYDVMGRLASYGASLWWYALSLRECPGLIEKCQPEVSKVDELLNAAVDAEAEAVAAVRTEGELSGNTGFSEALPSLESAFQEAMDTLGSSDR